MAGTTDPHRCALSGRRRRRRHAACAGTDHEREAGTAGGDRQSRRRERQPRHGDCRRCEARRLHAPGQRDVSHGQPAHRDGDSLGRRRTSRRLPACPAPTISSWRTARRLGKVLATSSPMPALTQAWPSPPAARDRLSRWRTGCSVSAPACSSPSNSLSRHAAAPGGSCQRHTRHGRRAVGGSAGDAGKREAEGPGRRRRGTRQASSRHPDDGGGRVSRRSVAELVWAACSCRHAACHRGSNCRGCPDRDGRRQGSGHGLEGWGRDGLPRHAGTSRRFSCATGNAGSGSSPR